MGVYRGITIALKVPEEADRLKKLTKKKYTVKKIFMEGLKALEGRKDEPNK